MKNIIVQQSKASEWLSELHPTAAFLIGLICSSFLAYYIPMVLVALTGRWINNLTMWLQTAIFMTAFMILNAITSKVGKRDWIVPVLAGTALTLYELSLVARGSRLEDWPTWWMMVALPLPMCLLNYWLFASFMRATEPNSA
jgi:hypothetical protein